MGIFNKKAKERITIQPPAQNRVEVELHKNATVEAANKAKEANNHLNDLLAANGFTLKIYLAAGGQIQQKKQRGSA